MDKLHRTARQIRSVVRLRQIEKRGAQSHTAHTETALRQAEQQLQEAETRHRQNVSRYRDAVQTGKAIDVTRHQFRMAELDYTNQQLQQQNGVAEDSKTAHRDALQTLVKSHKRLEFAAEADAEVHKKIREQQLNKEHLDNSDSQIKKHGKQRDVL